ncbi:MAG: hypothetical protein ABJE10_12305 [bacterium]
MWADTLEALERTHLLRLVIWGAASVLAGTGILAWLRVGSRQSPLLQHFGIQSAAWGAAEIALALALWTQVAPRDVVGATRLDRLLWLNIGLDTGYVLVGLALGTIGWKLGRRLGFVGAGIAVVVQGCALALLDLALVAQIST